jgi:defect in organelle trafficking protein DotD
MQKWILLLLCPLVITACVDPHKADDSLINTKTNALIALNETAKSVNKSLTSLNAAEQAQNPALVFNTPPNPATYGMAAPASLDWQGPVEPVVKRIAQAANYRLRVFGIKPSVPILVSIHQQDSNLGEILRNTSLQVKQRANIIVFPESKTIELHYKERG